MILVILGTEEKIMMEIKLKKDGKKCSQIPKRRILGNVPQSK